MKKIITNTIMSLLVVLPLLFITSCTNSNNNNQNNNNQNNNNESYEDIEMKSNIINVYLIGGQSNSVGYGMDTANIIANSDYRFKTGFGNVLYYGDQEYWSSGSKISTKFEPVKLGLGVEMDRSGAEIGIASAIADEDEMNAIIKCSWGATHLYPDTLYQISQVQGTWTSPSYIKKHNLDVINNPGIGEMYRRFETTVKNALNLLIKDGYTPVIKGMWWMQGEAEMYTVEMSSAYEELYETLINDVRDFMSETTGYDCSEMPFVCGLPKWNTNPSSNPDYAAKPPYQEVVRNAMVNVSKKVINASYIDCMPLTQHDGWHFDAAGQKYLGENFVKEIRKLTKGNNAKLSVLASLKDVNLLAEENGFEFTAKLTGHDPLNDYSYGFLVESEDSVQEIPCDVYGEEIDEYYDIYVNGKLNNISYTDINTKYSIKAYVLDSEGNYSYSNEIIVSLSGLASKELYNNPDDENIKNLVNAGVNKLFNVSESNMYKESDLNLICEEEINLYNTQKYNPTSLNVEQSPNANYYVKYTSSDTNVVKVDEEGNLITQSVGTADVTIECGGKTKTVKVNVLAKNIDDVIYDATVTSGEYPGKAIVKSNTKTSASINGVVKNNNIHLSLEITHNGWSPLNRCWWLNDNIEFYVDGVNYIVQFIEGVVKFSSNISYGVAKTVSTNGKLVTTVEMMIEGNKDEYKLKLALAGKKFEWMPALWEAAEQPNITTEGLVYAGLPSNLKTDGNFDESIWSSVNKNNNISVTANGATVHIVGTLLQEGVLLGITVNHKKAPDVSTNGSANWYTFLNVEFQFNNGGTQFIYTAKGEQISESFYGGHQSVKNVDGTYTTTFEIYIPFAAIGVSDGTPSLDFTCSGWIENGWCWFFPENQNWKSTHKISLNGIVRK